MNHFSKVDQPDEGYSEDPINPSLAGNGPGLHTLSALRSPADLPAWVSRHLSSLSTAVKTQLAMAILDGLPTTVIAEIVEKLNPRLYIDFIKYLPPEVCLKILGYLDPLSLLSVARSCRAWYDLALDRKLWQRLYFLEGWKAVLPEIQAYEIKANETDPFGRNRGLDSARLAVEAGRSGPTPRKRALYSPMQEVDDDFEMADADQAHGGEEGDAVMQDSIFGSSGTASAQKTSSMTPRLRKLMVDGVPDADQVEGKGKGVARTLSAGQGQDSVAASAMAMNISQHSLLNYDSSDSRYKINWKYLYTMRHRLEANWELAKFKNFQFPHPDHPEEGHGECIYSLQFNSDYLVSGSRDRTLRIWNLATRRLVRPPLRGHMGSVLCLQFDADPAEDLIVSGSSDSDVILWRFSTGEVFQRLKRAHRESVLNVKFDHNILVTCSKDKTIKIFNRRPLRPGDMGYPKGVNPAPARSLNRYGFNPSPSDDLAMVVQPYTMIGALEGHGAAVNAVQICGREIVSASGDRHIKVWDWPEQICSRTFLGHTKGIACVQYDGRRIVSGSSDNEVKVFDRETGLEVASLRAHNNLVRTVQAGFGDLPYSAVEDQLEARAVDREYFRAVEEGQLLAAHHHAHHPGGPSSGRPGRGRVPNAGSRRPEDITAYGAKLPPGGGGGKYGRIVSGSYDQTIIIWRRDKEGVWRSSHTLRQEEATLNAGRQGQTNNIAEALLRRAAAQAPAPAAIDGGGGAAHANAGGVALPLVTLPPPIPAHPATAPTGPPNPLNTALPAAALPAVIPVLPTPSVGPEQFANPGPAQRAQLTALIDQVVPQGPNSLLQALIAHPAMMTLQPQLQEAIDRETGAERRQLLRQVTSGVLMRTQLNQARATLPAGYPSVSAAGPSTSTAAGGSGAGFLRSAQALVEEPSTVPTPALTSTIRARVAAAAQPALAGGAAAGPATPGPLLAAAGADVEETTAAAPQMPTGSAAFPPAAAPTPTTPAPPITPAGQTSNSAAIPPMPPAPHPHHAHVHHNLQWLPQPAVAAPPQPQQQAAPQQAVAAAPAGAVVNNPAAQAAAAATAAVMAAAAAAANAQPGAVDNPARVFKLQFDARRIICCSQTHVIVGWDFCNGDKQLEEVSKFFATVD